MAVTPEIRAEIIAKFRQTRSPFKTADAVGVSVSEVFAVTSEDGGSLTSVEERHGGLGRPELRRYTVARRSVNERGWDNGNTAIAKAREDYEAGSHIMVTGRDGGWLILYSIPRRGKHDPKLGFFLPEVA